MLVVALGCSNRSAELGQTASRDMRALDRADESFPTKLAEAFSKLGAALIINPSNVAVTVKTKILPLVDEYVATIDRAVSSADAWLATTEVDDTMKRNLEIIRKRAEAFHKARERFVTLEQKARAGVSADEINQMLMTLSLMMSIGK